jgi:hypothetical protein
MNTKGQPLSSCSMCSKEISRSEKGRSKSNYSISLKLKIRYFWIKWVVPKIWRTFQPRTVPLKSEASEGIQAKQLIALLSSKALDKTYPLLRLHFPKEKELQSLLTNHLIL